MPANIEIKAKITDFARTCVLAEALSDTPAETLVQEDIFFYLPNASQGRLKLRQFSPVRGELIFYQRENSAGPKKCVYEIVPTVMPDSLKSLLAKALGVRGTVSKTRLLYRVGQTRIHLDKVKQLGEFLELEVVLRPGQSEMEGQQIASALMERLAVPKTDLIERAYIDLLIAMSE